MRNSFINLLCDRARTDKNIVLLTGDLGTGCLEPFINQFPSQFVNCGIAEQNMIGVAGGLAREGKKVFIYSIGNFDSLRAIEQIRNLVCYPNLDVNIVSVGAGFEYGSLGATHHATEDISCMRALPNMTVLTPADVSEAIASMEFMFKSSSPCYFRLNKKGDDITSSFKCAKNFVSQIYSGDKVALLSTGTILSECVKARELLLSKGVNASVVSIAKLPLDEKAVLDIINNYPLIVSVEEHTVVGGFGSSVAEVIAKSGSSTKLVMMGLNAEFASVVGKQDYLRCVYKIDADSIVKTVLKNIK